MVWNTPEVKQLNSERVRGQIQRCPKCTKAMVAKATSLSVATCNTIFNELLASGEIRIVDQEDAAMGRPAIRFEYNEDHHHVLGIAVLVGEGESIRYVIGNALGRVIREGRVPTAEVDAGQVEAVIEKCIAEDELIQYITIGIPGVNTGGIIEQCDASGLVGQPMEEKLKEKFGLHVLIRNDMDIVSYGIYHSSFSGKGSLCTLLFPPEGDSYVGAGIILDGKILTGASNFVGELHYIARAFGLSNEEMKKIRKHEELLIDFAVKMTVVLISTIDPKKLVIIGDGFDPNDIERIKKGCSQIVSNAHIPEMIIDNNMDENYSCGLIRLALNRIDFPLSEPV